MCGWPRGPLVGDRTGCSGRAAVDSLSPKTFRSHRLGRFGRIGVAKFRFRGGFGRSSGHPPFTDAKTPFLRPVENGSSVGYGLRPRFFRIDSVETQLAGRESLPSAVGESNWYFEGRVNGSS